MANEFDVLIRQLEVLEKIVISRPITFDNKDKQAIIKIIQKFQIVGEQIVGDKFENISGSTIVNRSLLSNAMNTVTSQYGEDVKNALNEISEHIEGTGDSVSAELFDGFNKELGNKESKKSVLKALWDGLVTNLPDAAKVTTAIATISKIFT
jgi:pyridoxal/pyridoxine/pyridoxamine kinase